jgi:transcriptional regulator with XRE-family HTH domain
MTEGASEYAAELQSAFGRHSRRGRQDLNLTQRQFAEKAGLNQKAVSAIEAGQVNVTLLTMAKVSRLLGMPLPAMLQPYQPASGGTG